MKKLLIFTCFALMLCLSVTGLAEAAEESLQTYRIQLFNEPQAIKVPKATTSYWFMIPAGVQVEEAGLTLILQSSETLLEDYSTATVEVNGLALSSVNLFSLNQTGETAWEIAIPVERLKTDGTLNQLSIVTVQRSILGDCADIDNPANWLVISDQSSLTLTLRQSGVYQLSSLYPFLFNRAELGNAFSTQFVLAGSDADAEAAAALNIASAIGANFPYKRLESLTVTGENIGDISGSRFLIDANASDPALSAGEGYLAVVQQPGGAAVQVAGGQAEGLEKAVSVLANADLLSQFSTDAAVIRNQAPRSGSMLEAKDDGLYTLEDFGYNDINLAGAFHQQTYFTVRQPDGIRGGSGSYFEVHFRHSDVLLSDTSLLTVIFDGVPASSIQLSRTNVDGGKLRVPIPREALDKGSFEISVDVYNYLGKIDCSKDWYDVAWTVIDKDSVLYLEPSENTVLPSLARFPSLYGDETVLCLPEDASYDVLQAMAALAARNGQNTQHVTEYSLAHSVDAKAAGEANVILAGRRDQITLPGVIADALYVVPAQDGYQVKEGVSTLPEALNGKIVLQAIRSPYNYKKTVYVILWEEGLEQQLAAWAADQEQLNGLSSELALIGDGGTACLSAAAEKEAAMPMTVDVLVNRAVRVTGIPRIGLIIILILVILIVILIIRQIRMRSRFSDAKVKMEQQNQKAKEALKPEKDQDEDDFDQDE